MYLPVFLTSFPDSTPGAVLPAASQLLLRIPSLSTLCQLVCSHPVRIRTLFTATHPTTSFINAVLPPLSSLSSLQFSFYQIPFPFFCLFPTISHFQLPASFSFLTWSVLSHETQEQSDRTHSWSGSILLDNNMVSSFLSDRIYLFFKYQSSFSPLDLTPITWVLTIF